jgi:hypothetical protein
LFSAESWKDYKETQSRILVLFTQEGLNIQAKNFTDDLVPKMPLYEFERKTQGIVIHNLVINRPSMEYGNTICSLATFTALVSDQLLSK